MLVIAEGSPDGNAKAMLVATGVEDENVESEACKSVSVTKTVTGPLLLVPVSVCLLASANYTINEFLDAQFRAASQQNLDTTYGLRFEQGLDLAGDAADKLTEKLVKFASGAAYVTAIAEVQQ